jgi:dCTP diphosphatase
MNQIDDIQKKIRDFRDERDWLKFHNAKDMAAAIAIEAAELQSLFLWKSATESADVVDRKEERVREEIADIAIYLVELADNLNIDLIAAMEAKIVKNAKKYPAEQVRGNAKKYTEYSEKDRDAT